MSVHTRAFEEMKLKMQLNSFNYLALKHINMLTIVSFRIGYGLSPVRHQGTTWANNRLWLTGIHMCTCLIMLNNTSKARNVVYK